MCGWTADGILYVRIAPLPEDIYVESPSAVDVADISANDVAALHATSSDFPIASVDHDFAAAIPHSDTPLAEPNAANTVSYENSLKFTYGNVASEEELEYILDTTGDEEKQDAFDVVFVSLDHDQQREVINKTLDGTLPHRALAGAALEDPRVNEYGVLHLDDYEEQQEMELAFLGSRLEIPDQPALGVAISARLAIDALGRRDAIELARVEVDGNTTFIYPEDDRHPSVELPWHPGMDGFEDGFWFHEYDVSVEASLGLNGPEALAAAEEMLIPFPVPGENALPAIL